MSNSNGKNPPGEIFGFFLRLGLTAFGGPAAHIALMEREAVERRGWLSRERFLDLVGACNLLPGPSSTQVAMALGYTRGGWMGLMTAGVCFILPASLATLALAWAYVRYGSLPQAVGLLYGAKPVMVAIVAQAVWRLGRMALRGWAPALAGLGCLAAVMLGAPPFLVLVSAGVLALLVAWGRARKGTAPAIAWLPAGLGGAVGAAGATQPQPGWRAGWSCAARGPEIADTRSSHFAATGWLPAQKRDSLQRERHRDGILRSVHRARWPGMVHGDDHRERSQISGNSVCDYIGF